MNDQERKIKVLRYSNVSSADTNFSSDEESPQDTQNSPLTELLYYFKDPSVEHQQVYLDFSIKLGRVLAQLTEEIEPVNIREDRTIVAQSIKLNTVVNSKLCRRRSTLPPVADR